MEQQNLVITKRNERIILGAAVGTSIAFISQPANAQISEIENTITSLQNIATTATTVVVVAMGVRMAIKLVNRVMVKG